jgi:hypothetical protein
MTRPGALESKKPFMALLRQLFMKAVLRRAYSFTGWTCFSRYRQDFRIRVEIPPSLGARLGSGWNCGFLVCIYFLDLSRFSCYKSFVTAELPQMPNPILIESLSPDSALRKRVVDPVLPMRLERFQTQDSDRVWKFLLSRSGQGAFVPSVSF